MAAVGSYLRSLQEREETEAFDEKAACALVLKTVGRVTGPDRPAVAFDTLISLTGLPVPAVRTGVNFLIKSGLLTGDDDHLSLTELGYRAQFVVAS